MITQQLSPKLESAIKPILALSPHEQLQVITVLLQTLFGWSEEKTETTRLSANRTEKQTRAYGIRKGEFVVPDDFDDPLFKEQSNMEQTRPVGLCEGEFVVPDDFDDPLPDYSLDAFEGR